MANLNTQVQNKRYVAITIPATGGTGTQLSVLLAAAGYAGDCNGLIIDTYLAGTAGNAGAQRPAFLVATPRAGNTAIAAADFTTHGRYIAAGQVYYDPVTTDTQLTYVQSASASTIVALAIVLL